MTKKYAMIQINSDVHQSLKEFCKDKGYKINGLVESLIREKIKGYHQPNKNVLPTTKS
jgi:hypothetical protein